MTHDALLFFLLFPYAGCSAFSPPAATRTHHAATTNSISSELALWQRSLTSSYFGGGASSSCSGSNDQAVSIMRRRWNSASPPSSPLSATNSTVNIIQISHKKKRIAIIFAFLTGWVDYIFIKKYNYFATMHTGNTMKMAIAIINGQYHESAFYLTIILSYMMGVGIFHYYHVVELSSSSSYTNKGTGIIIHALFAPIVVTCFVVSNHLLLLPNATTAAAAAAAAAATTFKFIPAILLSFAWGIINQIGNNVTGTLIFVVTGAMTRISTMIVDRLLTRSAGRSKTIPKDNLLLALSVIIGFILGAAGSACVSVHMSQQHYLNREAFSIIGVIYGLLFLWLDRSEIWTTMVRCVTKRKKKNI